MRRRCATAALAAVLFSAAACAVDGPRSGDRDPCSGDDDMDCDPVALAGAEEACWRLVQCGAVPAANPESEPSCCFDWAACVNRIESLPDDQFELALACIEASQCDELKAESGDLPRCLDQL